MNDEYLYQKHVVRVMHDGKFVDVNRYTRVRKSTVERWERASQEATQARLTPSPAAVAAQRLKARRQRRATAAAKRKHEERTAGQAIRRERIQRMPIIGERVAIYLEQGAGKS